LAEARRQPLVIILEDLHWADDSSLGLLAFLVDSIHRAPIMVYAISRPDLDEQLVALARLAEQRQGLAFLHLQLESLSPVQSQELFGELLKIPDLPEYFRLLVLKRAEGVPFYLEEILRMLIDEGVIEFVAGHWRMVAGSDATSLRVPGSLQDLILTRLDKLGPAHLKVLQAASVIGVEFHITLLSQILPDFDEERLQKYLRELVERAFLISPDDGDRFQFRHVLTSDGVYSTLMRGEKQRLHGMVAEALENGTLGNPEAQVEVLATHYLRSSRLDRALYFLILAGQKAAREYANQQSRQHFDSAAGLLSKIPHTPDQARQVWTGLGDVLTFLGDYPQARDNYLKALSECDRLTDLGAELMVFRERSSLRRKIATTYERQGEYGEALQQLAEANQILDQSMIPSVNVRASISNSVGWIYFLQGRFKEARQSFSTALKLVEGGRHFDILASIHNRLGAVAYQERSYYEAEMHVSESLALRERMNDKSGVARLYNNLGLLGLVRGNLRLAEESFTKSCALLERIGDAEGIALSNINLGLVKIDRGDLESAATYLAKAIFAAEQIGHRYYLALAKLYIGRINTEAGDYPAADRLLQESLSAFTEMGALDGRIDALTYLGENGLASQDIKSAARFSALAQVELDQPAPGNAASEVQLGRVLRLQGKIARAERDFGRAREKLEGSERIFSGSGEKLELGRTYLEIGRLARENGSRSLARGHFEKAGMIFDQLGAERDRILADAELESLR
jgi:predicted ATPase